MESFSRLQHFNPTPHTTTSYIPISLRLSAYLSQAYKWATLNLFTPELLWTSCHFPLVYFTLKTQMEHVVTSMDRCLCQRQCTGGPLGCSWLPSWPQVAVWTVGGQRALGIASDPQHSTLLASWIQHEESSPHSLPSATVCSLLRPGHGFLSQDGWTGSRLAERSPLEMDCSSCDIWASACPPSWTLCWSECAGWTEPVCGSGQRSVPAVCLSEVSLHSPLCLINDGGKRKSGSIESWRKCRLS